MQDSKEALIQENQKLKRQIQDCHEEIELYQQGFLSREKIFMESGISDALELIKKKEPAPLSKEPKPEPSYQDWKSWLLEENWSLTHKEILEIMNTLFSDQDEIFSQTAAQIREKTLSFWGEKGPSNKEREWLQKTSILLSLICGVWENNF